MKLAINGGNPAISEIIDDWKDIQKDDINCVSKYLEENELSVINGGILNEFEEKFAKFIGTKYAVAYCNGTAALHAASYACGANKESTFILSEYSYHGTVNSVLENSSKVVLCDYDKKTLNIDLDSAERLIDKNTKGIIITHCWGNPVDMDKIEKLRSKYNLKIISDASHAHGAMWNGKNIGSLGCEDIACFSLGKNKLISAGELGIAVTNDPNLYDKLLFFGHPNRVPEALITKKYIDYANGIGNKYRPHPLSMVLAIQQLNRYSKKKELNIKTNKFLVNEINKIPGFKPIESYSKSDRVFWKLLIRANNEYWEGIKFDKIVEALKAEGIKLEQFHNYNISAHEHIWKHERYMNLLENKSVISTPEDILVMPGYIDVNKKQLEEIVEAFKKISEYKEELR